MDSDPYDIDMISGWTPHYLLPCREWLFIAQVQIHFIIVTKDTSDFGNLPFLKHPTKSYAVFYIFNVCAHIIYLHLKKKGFKTK